jgi:hypothetical protein
LELVRICVNTITADKSVLGESTGELIGAAMNRS